MSDKTESENSLMNENANEESEIIGEIDEEAEAKIEDGEELGKDKDEEYKSLYDKYLRVCAEYENFRKRTAKEKEGIYSSAIIDVLSNILPVADNMERAMQFSDAAKVLEGLKMIYTQFTDSLARLGVEEIKSDGEKFDPEFHNAVFHEEDENQPENTITATLQKGYTKGDKVIRTAMVKVVN